MDENKYVELEAKYNASTLPVSDFQAAMTGLEGESKTVVGLDTFFSDRTKVFRYRRGRPLHAANPVDKQALTYKQRRRKGDISDRTEIDLWLSNKASEQDVRAMLEVVGMLEHFTITKESWIWHIPDVDGVYAVFALYDVYYEGLIRRFLEVEIERRGTAPFGEARDRLEWWKTWIETKWPNLGPPLNTSLYEMYAPRNDLFVPESF